MKNKLCCVLTPFGRCDFCEKQWCESHWNIDFTHYRPQPSRSGVWKDPFFCPTHKGKIVITTVNRVVTIADPQQKEI